MGGPGGKAFKQLTCRRLDHGPQKIYPENIYECYFILKKDLCKCNTNIEIRRRILNYWVGLKSRECPHNRNAEGDLKEAKERKTQKRGGGNVWPWR